MSWVQFGQLKVIRRKYLNVNYFYLRKLKPFMAIVQSTEEKEIIFSV